MALSPVLSFPFIPLFLSSLTLPKRKASGSDNCNTQIPNRPLTHTQILTSCVFCVPWLVALPLAPVKQTHSNEGRCKIKESLFLHGKHTHTHTHNHTHTHTYLSFVFLLLDLHLSCFFIRLGCRTGKTTGN